MRSSLSGPQPVIFGALAGLGLGFLHGFMSTFHEFPSSAPFVEGARGWFLGMAIVLAAIIISGNASTKPKGTPLYGHFFGISKIVQRFIIASAMIVGMWIFILPRWTPDMFIIDVFGPVLLAIALSFPIRNILEGLYDLSGSIVRRMKRRPRRRRPLAGSRPPGPERPRASKPIATNAPQSQAARKSTTAVGDPYDDPDAHAAPEGLLPGYDYPDPDEVKSKYPWWRRKHVDQHGKLITPDEVLREGNLPPIEGF
jgi:hypothetical protein